MSVRVSDIRRWLHEGKNQNATHMIVVCDDFDLEDFPVYVFQNQNVKDVEKEQNSNHQRIIEVYSYNHDLEEQLKETRAFHYD